jgi:hypothetical protein
MRLLPILTSTLLQNKRINTHLFSCINNIDKPACNTCKFYKPEDYSYFDSTSSKCSLYGNKNLHTGEIEYSYATECRKNETLCGQEGKLYEENTSIIISKIHHHFSKYSIIYKVCIFYFILVYLATK